MKLALVPLLTLAAATPAMAHMGGNAHLHEPDAAALLAIVAALATWAALRRR